MPRSASNFASRSRICAWMVTSSAVVGSSAIRTSGSTASAAAIITRCFCPPESWKGYCSKRASGSGMPTALSNSIAFARAAWPEIPRCLCITSTICRPTVSTGLSAVEGSWKIIATRRPRTARMAASGSASRSTPPSVTRPPIMRPASGNSRVRDSAVIDLPQPDSPTSAKHSPGASSKLRPSTARSGPPGMSSTVRRSSIFKCAPAGRSRRAPRRQTGWRPAPAAP